MTRNLEEAGDKTRYGDKPEEAIEIALRTCLDAIGVTIAGAGKPLSRAELLEKFSGCIDFSLTQTQIEEVIAIFDSMAEPESIKRLMEIVCHTGKIRNGHILLKFTCHATRIRCSA